MQRVFTADATGLLLLERITTANTLLRDLLADARKALSGERDFGPEQVQAFSGLLAKMAPVMAEAKAPEASQSEIASEVEVYKGQLRELQIVLDHVRMMLLARRSQMDAGSVQLQAVTQWATALGQTR